MRFDLSLLISLAATASAHTVLLSAKGDGGEGVSKGMGVKDDVSRIGTGRPAQLDTSVIREREVASGRAGPCGRTGADGPIKIKEELEKAATAGMAQVKPGGTVVITSHVINADGRGPFKCTASADEGENWSDAEVTTNIPAYDSSRATITAANDRTRNTATDFPLAVKLPSGMTGNAKGVVVVRCVNTARAGPFGGCVAITVVQ